MESSSEDEISAESSTSRVIKEKLVFVWNISNYSFLGTPTGQKIESPRFYSKNNKNLSWYLRLYPRGDQNPDFLSLFLRLENLEKNAEDVIANYFVFFVDSNEEKIPVLQSNCNEKFVSANGWGRKEAFELETLSKNPEKYLSNDELKIFCEVIFGSNVATSIESPEKIRKTRKRKRTVEPNVNLGLLHQSGKFSDLTLVSDTKKLKVHRSILAAASPVFWELFQSEENNLKAEIKFNDVSFPVLQEIVRYIYTNSVENLDDLASQLIVAANKYSMTELRKVCDRKLCEQLNSDNIFDMLLIANSCNATKLKRKVVYLFGSNKKKLVKSAEYKQFMESEPLMIAELYTILTNAE